MVTELGHQDRMSFGPGTVGMNHNQFGVCLGCPRCLRRQLH